MRIAIIPARGGSKRIPRKNIKPFNGKPMIAWSIETAKSSGLFERIIVSTDDEEIADIAKTYGAEVPFMRPAELADDFTGTVPVIAHAINTCQGMGWHIDKVCCIYPGNPFLQEIDLVSALKFLEINNAKYVFPIATYPSAIQRALRQLPDGNVQPFYQEYTSSRTQDLEPAYFDAGQFYWGSSETWLEGKIIHQNALGLVIPEWRVVDIDTQDDWIRAEMIYVSLIKDNNKTLDSFSGIFNSK
jgi:pseudaminic acid cytidylyltransferase